MKAYPYTLTRLRLASHKWDVVKEHRPLARRTAPGVCGNGSAEPLGEGRYENWNTHTSADPDETPHHVASHQGLHCLLKRKSFYVKLMKKKQFDTPKMKNGLF